MKRQIKVCFASSSGGHLEQLMMLMPLIKKYNGFVITEDTAYKSVQGDIRVRYIPQINRSEKCFVLKMVRLTFKSIAIFLQERPDVVVSTGALATFPVCVMAKIFRKKLIYIESFAKILTPTVTGKVLYKYADRFYVQWETMKEVYPDAIYLGGLY